MNQNTINYIIIALVIAYLVFQDCNKSVKKEKMMEMRSKELKNFKN